MDPLSTVWNHQQEERKECFGLGPTAKTFLAGLDGKVEKRPILFEMTQITL